MSTAGTCRLLDWEIVVPDTRPLVTVVTPSYNYGRYVGQCLESVRRQTYRPIEHIVLDADSSDGSATIIRSFAGTYGLSAVFERDEGQADAINRGFARGRGEVFCWLNADDYWLGDGVVEDAVSALESGCDVVTGGGAYVDEDGRVLGDIAPNYGRPLSALSRSDTLLQPATFWWKRVHRPLRRDLRYAFDWRMFLEMRAAGAVIRIAEGTRWAAYRWHAINKTARDPAARKAEVADVLREQCGRLSPEHLWARLVQGGYVLAEATRVDAVKRVVRKINVAMWRVTRGRVYSP